MTAEVGAISGDLWLRLDLGPVVDVRVTYAEADEWYTVSGSPLATDVSAHQAADLAQSIVEHLSAPTAGLADGNPEPLDLSGFRP